MKSYIPDGLDIGWKVTLSSGDIFYDWDRDTDSGTPSWFILSDYIKNNAGDRIVSMQLFYQTNFSEEGDFAGVSFESDNSEGYFYTKRVSAIMGDKNCSGENYGIGYLKDGKVYITWFNNRVQALESEVRNQEDCGFGLILNNE